MFFFIQKFGRKIRDAVEAAMEKYPADPSVVIMTEEKLRSLEETLVWRWVGLIFFFFVELKTFLVDICCFDFSYHSFFPLF